MVIISSYRLSAHHTPKCASGLRQLQLNLELELSNLKNRCSIRNERKATAFLFNPDTRTVICDERKIIDRRAEFRCNPDFPSIGVLSHIWQLLWCLCNRLLDVICRTFSIIRTIYTLKFSWFRLYFINLIYRKPGLDTARKDWMICNYRVHLQGTLGACCVYLSTWCV